MSDALIVLHTVIAIIAIVLLIVVAKVDPLISLVIGALYLGVAAGLGFRGTIGSLTQGFGDIMAEVGLLIGFGVLMGSCLAQWGLSRNWSAAAENTRPPKTTLRVQRCPE